MHFKWAFLTFLHHIIRLLRIAKETIQSIAFFFCVRDIPASWQWIYNRSRLYFAFRVGCFLLRTLTMDFTLITFVFTYLINVLIV